MQHAITLVLVCEPTLGDAWFPSYQNFSDNFQIRLIDIADDANSDNLQKSAIIQINAIHQPA